MDLFHFREESPGSVFWHRKRMEFISKIHFIYENETRKAGYKEINTPEILDRSLWEKSGHWKNLVPICIHLQHLMKKFLL